MYIVMKIGCLECGTWSYVYGVYDTLEDGTKGLLELANEAQQKSYSEYKESKHRTLEIKDLLNMKDTSPYTCISYYRGIDWIAELHSVDGVLQ